MSKYDSCIVEAGYSLKNTQGKIISPYLGTTTQMSFSEKLLTHSIHFERHY